MVEKQRDKGVAKPFPYVDLRVYLPTWCADGRANDQEDTYEEGDGPNEASKNLAKALGVPTTKAKPRLTLLQWEAAYDRWAVAAAAAGLLSYAAALKHKDNCRRLTEEARGKGLKGAVGLVYDHLARRQWADYSYNEVDGFDLEAACSDVDKTLASQAEREVQTTGKGADGKGLYGKGKDHGWRDHGGKGYGGKGGSSYPSSWNRDQQDTKRPLPWDRDYQDAKRQKGKCDSKGKSKGKGKNDPNNDR